MQNQQAFTHWVEGSLPPHVKVVGSLKLRPLAGDAGFRRYFRSNTSPSLIVVNSPPDKEKNPAFIKISLFLQSMGVRTPAIYAVNFKQGYMLLEDFGESLFLNQLNQETESGLYATAETITSARTAAECACAFWTAGASWYCSCEGWRFCLYRQ